MGEFMNQVGSLAGHPGTGSGNTNLPMSPPASGNIWQGTTPQGSGQSSNPFSLSFAPARPALPTPMQAGQSAAPGLLNNPMIQNGGSMLINSLMGLL